MRKLMHFLARLFPNSATGENPAAVRMFSRLTSVRDFFKRIRHPSQKWPVYPGNYQVANPKGRIAVCTLTSDHFTFENEPGRIAIVGTLITPNLGIERMILNIISNSNIRHLVLCGKDSPIFKAGQALECLFEYGIDQENRIINAVGFFPVLKNLSKENVDHFLNQVNLIDVKDEKDSEVIKQKIAEINVHPEAYHHSIKEIVVMEKEKFIPIRTGGRRVPLDYDQKGFFVITLDYEVKQIVVRHYHKDNQPGFILKGHSSESILLAIVEKDLVSQMSHAGYLGAELAKAETALRLKLNYVQDQSLREDGN